MSDRSCWWLASSASWAASSERSVSNTSSCDTTPSRSCAGELLRHRFELRHLLLQFDPLPAVGVEVDQRVLHFLERADHGAPVLLLGHLGLRLAGLDARLDARVEYREG